MKGKLKVIGNVKTSGSGYNSCDVEIHDGNTVYNGNVFLGKEPAQPYFKLEDEVEFTTEDSQYGLKIKIPKPSASGGGSKPSFGSSFKESREDWVMKNKSIIAQSSMSSAVEYMRHLPQEKVNGKMLTDIAEVIYNFVISKSELK